MQAGPMPSPALGKEDPHAVTQADPLLAQHASVWDVLRSLPA